MINNGYIDLTDVQEATEYTLIPSGKYHVVVTKMEAKMSKNNNPVFNLTLRVVGGEFDGATFHDIVVFTEGAKPRVKNVMKHLCDVNVDGGQVHLPSVEWVGKQAIADVVVEENTNEANGQTYTSNKVKWGGYSKPDGFSPVTWGQPPVSVAVAAPAAAPAPPKPVVNGTAPAPNGATKKMPF